MTPEEFVQLTQRHGGIVGSVQEKVPSSTSGDDLSFFGAPSASTDRVRQRYTFADGTYGVYEREWTGTGWGDLEYVSGTVQASDYKAQQTAAQGTPGQMGLNDIYQLAIDAGLGEEGAKVAVSIASIEGGMSGAVGDSGNAFGPFQFHTGGQLPAFASSLGMTVQEAGEYARRNPTIAAKWALDNYLGQAIIEGQRQGLTGAGLTTFVQTNAQRSVNPEKAGEAYLRLFQGGDSGAMTEYQKATLGLNQSELDWQKEKFGIERSDKNINPYLQAEQQISELIQDIQTRMGRGEISPAEATQQIALARANLTAKMQGTSPWEMQTDKLNRETAEKRNRESIAGGLLQNNQNTASNMAQSLLSGASGIFGKILGSKTSPGMLNFNPLLMAQGFANETGGGQQMNDLAKAILTGAMGGASQQQGASQPFLPPRRNMPPSGGV